MRSSYFETDLVCTYNNCKQLILFSQIQLKNLRRLKPNFHPPLFSSTRIHESHRSNFHPKNRHHTHSSHPPNQSIRLPSNNPTHASSPIFATRPPVNTRSRLLAVNLPLSLTPCFDHLSVPIPQPIGGPVTTHRSEGHRNSRRRARGCSTPRTCTGASRRPPPRPG